MGSAHFLKMFGGNFVTLLGGVEREAVTKDTDGTMLFQVKSECNDKGDRKPITRTNQIEEVAGNLNSDDVFILKTPSKLYIYEGQNSSAEEKETAQKVARTLFPAVSAEGVAGSRPPRDFLSALN